MAEQEEKKGPKPVSLPRSIANDNTAPITARPAEQSEKLKALLQDLNRPLEDVDWSHTSLRAEKGDTPAVYLKRLRQERDHRRDLHRAREAAQSAFKVNIRRAARKRATAMLTAGAVGLAAFTGPPFSSSNSRDASVSFVQDYSQYRGHATQMSASDDFKQALIEEEGVRYTVYRDVAGYPTVGVGHLVRPGDGLRVGDRIDERRVMALLDADLAEAEDGVRQLVGDLELYQHEFDALLDLVYNVGAGNVSPAESPRLNAAIDAGDYEAIATELDYTHAAGKFTRGLKNRSDRRAEIFMNADYADPREDEGRTST